MRAGGGAGGLAYPADGSAAEEGHLLPATLDHRVQPQERLELVEVRPLGREERAQVVPLHDVPALLADRLAQERRALELVTDEVGPLRCDRKEANVALVRADPGV